MLLLVLVTIASFANGCINDIPQVGVWSIKVCDSIWKAAELLGVNVEVIKILNPPNITDWYILPGNELNVPYYETVLSPATWYTTLGCTPKLHLGFTSCTSTPSSTLVPTTTHSATDTPSVASSSTSVHCYRNSDSLAHQNNITGLVHAYAMFACKSLIEKKQDFNSYEDDLSFFMKDPSNNNFHHYFSVRWTQGCDGPRQISSNCSEIMYNNFIKCEYQCHHVQYEAKIQVIGLGGGQTYEGCLVYQYEPVIDTHTIDCHAASCTQYH